MDDSQVSVVLAGGGTAGHVNPLLSIAAAIRSIEPHTRITVVGTAQGLESRLVPAAGFSLVTIKKVPFPRRPNLDALAFPGRWVSETRRVRRLLKDVAADVVVGVGGYAAAPAYRAGKKQGLPVIIHEQNAKAGLANKLGARWADFVGTVYDDTGITVRRGATLQRVGLPLRSEISHLSDRLSTDRASVREESARKLGLDPSRPIVVVTGGSLGAVSLNTAVSGAAKALLDGTKVQIYHLTGKGKADEVRSRVVTECGDGVLGRDYVVAEYLDHMEWALGCADLVICRSGAGTVSEIAALGLPAIYVPFPIGNGEQRFNAQPVVSAGGGLLVDDAEFTSTWVCEHVPHLLVDTARLETMRQKAWKYGVRDAAETMARVILERAHAARRSQYVK